VGIRLADFDTVISESDFVSVHVPLSPSTRNLIGADVLGKMRPGAILVNLSRGGVVDELALAEALIGGHLGGAGLDVHTAEGEGKVSPLAHLPNVILTPHIGAVATDAQDEIGRLIVECVRRGATPEDLQPGVPKNFVVI
jgi:phosphoglycerate dehydrogenase-like enzyme